MNIPNFPSALVLIVGFGISGCAHEQVAKKPALHIGLPAGWESAPPGARAARTGYALGRAAAWGSLRGSTHNDSGDDYKIELAAWEAALMFWTRRSARESDPDLDLVSQVMDAGFIREFVLLVYGKPGWTVPAKDIEALNVPVFLPWAQTHLMGHHIGAVASTVPDNGKRWPDVPGAFLPDPNAIRARNASALCSPVEELEAALESWRPAEMNLDGSPVAAFDREDFLRRLALLKAQSAIPSRGATWVDPRVAGLFMYLGYCANDRQDWPRAQLLLQHVVEMSPTDFSARLELAQAFIAAKMPARAVPHLEAVLGSTTNPCALAQAWRKIGFIRFEERRYPEARQAYETSLQYEPGSVLAANELKLIMDVLGKKPGETPPEFHPPAQMTTRCTAPESAPASGPGI